MFYQFTEVFYSMPHLNCAFVESSVLPFYLSNCFIGQRLSKLHDVSLSAHIAKEIDHSNSCVLSFSYPQFDSLRILQFANVYKAKDTETGEFVAIKKVISHSMSFQSSFTYYQLLTLFV